MSTPATPADPIATLVGTGLLDDVETDIQHTVRRFADEALRPHLAEWYEAGTIPARDLGKQFGAMGLLGMHLEGYGCTGTNAVSYGAACLELEAADSGLRSFVSVQGSLSMYSIHRWGTEEQKQEWLPRLAAGEAIGCFGLTEADHGSDPAGMRTVARRDGSDWVLDGSKMWITNAPVADVATIWAQTDEGIRGFLVPTATPGFAAHEVPRKMSLRASITGEIVLEGVRLPADAAFPEVRGLKGPLSCLNEARFGIVWGAVGAARDCLETAIAYATAREQFDRPIAGFQLTQQKLADMALEVAKGYLLAVRLGRLKDDGLARPEMVSAAKLNNVREAIEVARTARTILGGSGITLDYPVIRHAMNLESVLTYEGTSEIHTLVVGKALTGLDAFR
ncbi:MAG: acyl-CoA dehydrogenase family protein [Kineosporiaceae bacterium]